MFRYSETEDGVILTGFHYVSWAPKSEFYNEETAWVLEGYEHLYRLISGELKADIVIPKTINNKEVVSLQWGEGFFGGTNIRTITIPYSVKEIDNEYTNFLSRTPFLTTISFPEGKNSELEIPDNKWGADESVQILGKNGEILE